jgi:hypothetical protein
VKHQCSCLLKKFSGRYFACILGHLCSSAGVCIYDLKAREAGRVHNEINVRRTTDEWVRNFLVMGKFDMPVMEVCLCRAPLNYEAKARAHDVSAWYLVAIVDCM